MKETPHFIGSEESGDHREQARNTRFVLILEKKEKKEKKKKEIIHN